MHSVRVPRFRSQLSIVIIILFIILLSIFYSGLRLQRSHALGIWPQDSTLQSGLSSAATSNDLQGLSEFQTTL